MSNTPPTPPTAAGPHPHQPPAWPTGPRPLGDSPLPATRPSGEGIFAPLTDFDPFEISGYPLQARIGEGGMGSVYLSHTRGGRPLALKVVRPEFATDPDFRARFAKEVAIAQRVQGPYTVPVIDADVDAVRPWVATVYVPAPSLAVAVARAGGLPPSTVLMLIAGVAEALQSIHSAGVVHRDLKPGNVILAPDGPRVIDFGVARAIDAATAAMTQTGTRLGTPAFMAPEQVQGRQLDRPGDVFALGATAYFALTGRPPFGVDAAVFHRIEHQQPDWTGCPEDLREILSRCMAKDPASRPTPAELIELCRFAAPVGRLTTHDHPDTGSDWLPPTVTAEITRYRLARLPDPPTQQVEPPTQQVEPPTQQVEPPTQQARQTTRVPPTAAPPGPPGSPGPRGDSPRPLYAFTAGPGRGRSPRLLRALGAVAFVVVCSLAAVLLTRSDEPPPSAPMTASAVAPRPGGDPAGSGGQGPGGPAAAASGLTTAGPGQTGPTAPAGADGSTLPGGGRGMTQPDQPGGPPVTGAPPASSAPAQAPRTTPAAKPTATPSATTSGCPGKPSHNYNGDGYGVLVEQAALRVGPYAACSTVSKLAKGLRVWLHCSVVNKYDNVWWWARLDGTTTAGWIYSGDLKLHYVDDDKDGKARTYSCSGKYTDH